MVAIFTSAAVPQEITFCIPISSGPNDLATSLAKFDENESKSDNRLWLPVTVPELWILIADAPE